MSVRVLGATGKMFEASYVIPMVEARINFNGRTERRFEMAKSLDENPTGLMFISKINNLDWTWISMKNQIEYIGNISTEVIREILAFMLVEGFYNFSDWDYQKENDLNKIILDNGKSQPYSSAITRGAFTDFMDYPSIRGYSNREWEFFYDSTSTSECLKRNSKYSEEEWDEEEWDEEWNYDDTEEDSWEDEEYND